MNRGYLELVAGVLLLGSVCFAGGFLFCLAMSASAQQRVRRRWADSRKRRAGYINDTRYRW